MKVRHHATRAYVLRTLDTGEADVWLDLLTPRGLMRALAKNGRRSTHRFPGALESYAHVQASLTRRLGLWYLDEAVVARPAMALREDLVALGLAGYAAEAFLTAWEADEPIEERVLASGAGGPHVRSSLGDPGPFETFEALMRQVADRQSDPHLTLAVLELRLLDLLGVMPELSACIACRGASEVPLTHVDIEGGGALCDAHARRAGPRSVPLVPVQAGTLPLLKRLATAPDALRRRVAPTAGQCRALLSLVRALAAWHRPHAGRAHRFLVDALARRASRGTASPRGNRRPGKMAPPARPVRRAASSRD